MTKSTELALPMFIEIFERLEALEAQQKPKSPTACTYEHLGWDEL